MRTTWLVVALLIGCGNDGKDGTGNNTPDAAPVVDAPPDVPDFLDAPATTTVMVTISGTVTERTANGAAAVGGASIVAYRNASETTPIAMTTSDGFGAYSLTIQTNGEAIDGFLKATKSGYLDTYLYPPYPLEMDFANASVIMVTQGTYDALSTLAQGNQQPGKGLIGLVVTDGNNPVGGAMVTGTPSDGPVRYNAPNGNIVLPSTTATSTHTDGVAYVFNAGPGQVTVGATHASLTLRSHGLKARADVLTTTVIVP